LEYGCPGEANAPIGERVVSPEGWLPCGINLILEWSRSHYVFAAAFAFDIDFIVPGDTFQFMPQVVPDGIEYAPIEEALSDVLIAVSTPDNRYATFHDTFDFMSDVRPHDAHILRIRLVNMGRVNSKGRRETWD
jgi:hypothetical protein